MPTPKAAGTELCRLGLISDVHALSRYGVTPPAFIPANAGPSAAYANYCWDIWCDFVKRCPPLDACIVNGDAVEGPTPTMRSGPDAYDISPLRQVDAGIEIFGPLRQKCKKFWMVRGTPFHVGKDFEIEEALARELKAEEWSERRHTGFVLEKTWQGFSIHATHHVTFGTIYRGTKMDQTALFMSAAEAQCKVNHADILVRSHAHFAGIGRFHSKWYVQTPCWKLVNPHALQKLEAARAALNLDLGAIIVSTTGKRDLWWDDETFRYKPFLVKPGKLA